MYRLCYGRIQRLGLALRDMYIAIDKLVDADPQYRAVVGLCERVYPETAVLFTIGNALVSYRLVLRGEDYWSIFTKELVKTINNVPFHGFFKDFLSRYNRVGLNGKLSRIMRFSRSKIFRMLMKSPTGYCGLLKELNKELALAVNSDEKAKTVVFATKMYYYICRAYGADLSIDYLLPMPVDTRNAELSLKIGVITGCHGGIRKCVQDLISRKHRGLVIEAWNMVSLISGVPVLLIDTFTWLLSGVIRRCDSDERCLYEWLANEVSYPRLRHIVDVLL